MLITIDFFFHCGLILQPLSCDSQTRLRLLLVTDLRKFRMCNAPLWKLPEVGGQVGAKEETSFWCLGWDSQCPFLISLCNGWRISTDWYWQNQWNFYFIFKWKVASRGKEHTLTFLSLTFNEYEMKIPGKFSCLVHLIKISDVSYMLSVFVEVGWFWYYLTVNF